jgi:ubiquinone/menaquinone biosynthesis C-methylase UbiE
MSFNQPKCWYCTLFKTTDSLYKEKEIVDLSEPLTPRCSWHKYYSCDHCEKENHFNGIAWCQKCKKFYCLNCASEVNIIEKNFWCYDYYFELLCPRCETPNPALDFAEYSNTHPYQQQENREPNKEKLEKSTIPIIHSSPNLDHFLIHHFGWGVFANKQRGNREDHRPQETWDNLAKEWAPSYRNYGDSNHQYWILPTLFENLGDIEGLTILDAGTGEGYLARLLTRRKANVYAIDLSEKMLAYALKEEEKEPLGIKYLHGDLANMTMFQEETFDIVIANMMIMNAKGLEAIFKEIHRVLKTGGKFYFSILHPIKLTMSSLRKPRKTNRIEEQTYILDDYYDERPILATFGHTSSPDVLYPRTLSYYINLLIITGFELLRFEEPQPSIEGVEKIPWKYHRRNFPFCCWFFSKKK